MRGQVLTDDMPLPGPRVGCPISAVFVRDPFDPRKVQLKYDFDNRCEDGARELAQVHALFYDGAELWKKVAHALHYEERSSGSQHSARLSEDKTMLRVEETLHENGRYEARRETREMSVVDLMQAGPNGQVVGEVVENDPPLEDLHQAFWASLEEEEFGFGD